MNSLTGDQVGALLPYTHTHRGIMEIVEKIWFVLAGICQHKGDCIYVCLPPSLPWLGSPPPPPSPRPSVAYTRTHTYRQHKPVKPMKFQVATVWQNRQKPMENDVWKGPRVSLPSWQEPNTHTHTHNTKTFWGCCKLCQTRTPRVYLYNLKLHYNVLANGAVRWCAYSLLYRLDLATLFRKRGCKRNDPSKMSWLPFGQLSCPLKNLKGATCWLCSKNLTSALARILARTFWFATALTTSLNDNCQKLDAVIQLMSCRFCLLVINIKQTSKFVFILWAQYRDNFSFHIVWNWTDLA